MVGVLWKLERWKLLNNFCTQSEFVFLSWTCYLHACMHCMRKISCELNKYACWWCCVIPCHLKLHMSWLDVFLEYESRYIFHWWCFLFVFNFLFRARNAHTCNMLLTNIWGGEKTKMGIAIGVVVQKCRVVDADLRIFLKPVCILHIIEECVVISLHVSLSLAYNYNNLQQWRH